MSLNSFSTKKKLIWHFGTGWLLANIFFFLAQNIELTIGPDNVCTCTTTCLALLIMTVVCIPVHLCVYALVILQS